jgi:hypothetical protein
MDQSAVLDARSAKETQERLGEREDHPRQIVISGMNKPLSAIIEHFVGNWDLIDYNKRTYREKWKEFLPREKYNERKKILEVTHFPWSISIVPRIVVRKTFDHSARAEGGRGLAEAPYFLIVLNKERDNRPQKPKRKTEKDPLQENLIDKGIILSRFGGFYLTPNGFPYHNYASLMISEDESRKQKSVTAEDIMIWIKFSFLADQYVFFNSVNAGASQEQRFHAQVVDPEVLRYEGKAAEYPIRRATLKPLKGRKDVYKLEGYPMEVLAFVGKDAPHNAARLVYNLEEHGLPYNVLVDKDRVMLVGRNEVHKKSDCIGKLIGGYESSGVILVGNVEERILQEAGLEMIIHGDAVFTELNYPVIASNISAASMEKGWLEDLLNGHK